MIKEPSKKEVALGYLSQLLNIGSGILVIPLLVSFLSSDDMGLWYLFLAFGGMAQLLEFGLQPTIVRTIAYIYSGASDIVLDKVPERSGEVNNSLLIDVVQSIKYIYKVVSSLGFILLFTLGSLYLLKFDSFQGNNLLAWILFSLSTVLNLYFSYIGGILSGRGEQSKVYLSVTISKLLMLVACAPLLYLGYGLLSMGIAFFVSSFCSRLILAYYYKNSESYVEFEKTDVTRDYRFIIFKSAKKLGLVSIGSFFISKANTILVSSFFGLKVVAGYGLSLQVIGIISSVSGMFFYINIPRLSSLQVQRKIDEIKRLFFRSIYIVHLIYFISAFLLLVLGDYFLGVIGSETRLLELPLLIFILVVSQLDLNHSMCATYLTSRNSPPSPIPILISGLFVVLFSLATIKLTSLGVLGLILSQFIVQLSFNNWYWPYKAIKSFSNN